MDQYFGGTNETARRRGKSESLWAEPKVNKNKFAFFTPHSNRIFRTPEWIF
jgi:hypothetical protein